MGNAVDHGGERRTETTRRINIR